MKSGSIRIPIQLFLGTAHALELNMEMVLFGIKAVIIMLAHGTVPASPSHPVILVKILFPASKKVIAISCLLLCGCSAGKKDYLPGELEYDKSVEAAEYTLKVIVETEAEPSQYCGSVQDDYDQGVNAFERLMPNLRGMNLRNRDMRLQTIREFLEQHCS